MMKDFFTRLFEYNLHFNQKITDLITNRPNTISEKSRKLFNHVLNAHHIWNSRILEKQIEYQTWSIHPDDLLKDINSRNFNETRYILKNIALEKTVSYKNSKGQSFENKISDILFHIINHSTYHKGQIATDFRQNGIEPLNTDYIFYKREQNL